MAQEDNLKVINTNVSQFIHLPPEIHSLIFSHLPKADIKSLRLTCKHLLSAATFALNFTRVFISPATVNINVFRNVANNDRLSHSIRELFYDDARFSAQFGEDSDYIDEDDEVEMLRAYKEQCTQEEGHYDPDPTVEPDSDLDWAREIDDENIVEVLGPSYDYLKQLVQDQDANIAQDEDGKALRECLGRFSTLKRVTVSCVTYRPYFKKAKYRTPLVRAVPEGIRLPTPWSWGMGSPPGWSVPFSGKWEDLKQNWRGYDTAVREIVDSGVQIEEFVIDTNSEQTGIGHILFSEPSKAYERTKTIFEKLKVLDFSLNVDGAAFDWKCYRSGLLKRALEGATKLESFRWHTNWKSAPHLKDRRNLVPLLEIFPIESWPKLTKFALSRFLVDYDDLKSFITKLNELFVISGKLQRIELDDIDVFYETDVVDEGKTLANLLEYMRDELGWRDGKPEVSMANHELGGVVGERRVATKDIGNFLNGVGPNPLTCGHKPNMIMFGMGWDDSIFYPKAR